MPATMRRALELRAAAGKARGSSFPHLLRTHAGKNGGERSDPAPAAHRHIVRDGGSHSDLAPALEVNGADLQVLPRPPRRVNVGSGLDGDIIVDGDQIQRPGQVCVIRALKIVAHAGAELPQHECHHRRAAIHQTQREQHHVLQSADTPDSQMHLAPLGVYTGTHIVLVDVASHEELDDHDPEQARKGRGEPHQIEKNPDDDEFPEIAGRERLADVEKGKHADKGQYCG